MEEITIEEVKKRAFEILKFIKGVCDQNGIRYFLAYGTALGAVRHQGFIPWDDDIDIYMYREDFDKFRTVMKSNPNVRFELLYALDKKEYTVPFPKVIDKQTYLKETRQWKCMPLGVWVDIMPLDVVPEDNAMCEQFFKQTFRLRNVWSLLQYKPWQKGASLINNLVRCLSFPLWIISPKKMTLIIDKHARKYSALNSSRLGYMSTTVSWKRSVFPKKMIGDGSYLMFEGEEFRVPTKYHEYLTMFYGDYMTLPPVEKRVTHHEYVVYRK